VADVGSEQQNAWFDIRAVGPVAQAVPTPPTAAPSTINGGANYQTGIIPANGFKAISVGATLSQAGTISIQRFIDKAGTIPVGAAISATLTANTANWADVNDGVAYASFQVTIANTSGSVGTLSGFGMLLSAA
jgi:hypothetical protein